jgi:hypothetical protein
MHRKDEPSKESTSQYSRPGWPKQCKMNGQAHATIQKYHVQVSKYHLLFDDGCLIESQGKAKIDADNLGKMSDQVLRLS